MKESTEHLTDIKAIGYVSCIVFNVKLYKKTAELIPDFLDKLMTPLQLNTVISD